MPKSDTLIVAPYVGEFGWELMNWQGRVRWEIERRRPARAIICAPPDRRALYRDLIERRNVRFCPMPNVPWPGVANDDHRLTVDGRAMDPDELAGAVRGHTKTILDLCAIDSTGADWLMPGFRSALHPTSAAHQRFVSLGTPQKITTDIVLVSRVREQAAERNRPEQWWISLARRLESRGLRVAFQQPRLDRAVQQFSTARLAVGASTGGLHLASLCQCPHYVWGSGPESRWTSMAITNRQRYETVWNPLGTPCIYDEVGWQPSLEHVEAGVSHALRTIGMNREGQVNRTPNARWRVKRTLARVLEKSLRESPWPWRVRELVRNHLV
ncbi:MAG TPA: hypothetical protein VNT79_09340 [Phycisphaerae bacterium]|nr:hypothetical protein [Phycisphaerae bacterium]